MVDRLADESHKETPLAMVNLPGPDGELTQEIGVVKCLPFYMDMMHSILWIIPVINRI